MRRIGLLTAGGDTPALNATIHGAVSYANACRVEVIGFLNGFQGLLDPQVPHVHLNPLFCTIPELDPARGGTILGASRTYVDPSRREELEQVVHRLQQLQIEGLICVGGDGTITAMQCLTDLIPCVLAPKTIDNDLGLNYLDEPNEWLREQDPGTGEVHYRRLRGREQLELSDIVNYATPGYATAVFVAAQGVQRLRTTAESHRRIAIVETMGRQSGYIALGAAFGQPDLILIPEVPLNLDAICARIRELYDLQQHVVIVIGEGVVDEKGQPLGAISTTLDPAGTIKYAGAAEALKRILIELLGDELFRRDGLHESAESAIFTRKVGHTQRGGRPILFDRFYAAQLGGKALELLLEGHNNSVATLQWSDQDGFHLQAIPASRLSDKWGVIHPRQVHPSFYDPHNFSPSRLGIDYLLPIFRQAIGADDVEHLRQEVFNPANLRGRYSSVNIDIHKRVRHLSAE